MTNSDTLSYAQRNRIHQEWRDGWRGVVRRRSCLVNSHSDSVRGDPFEAIVCDLFSEHSQPGESVGRVCYAYCDPRGRFWRSSGGKRRNCQGACWHSHENLFRLHRVRSSSSLPDCGPILRPESIYPLGCSQSSLLWRHRSGVCQGARRAAQISAHRRSLI